MVILNNLKCAWVSDFLINNIIREILYKIHRGKQGYGAEFSQPAITCSKLTIETLEQGVKYVQSNSFNI